MDGQEEEDVGESAKPSKAAVRSCPYLDTIRRTVLDFDFEKVCSVTLAKQNVYACLVCGKYFQGRGRGSQAHKHALQANHHVFINLSTEKIYCLPDDYEVVDASLRDIKYYLNPRYTREDLQKLDTWATPVRGLDGSEYLVGLMGLNDIRSNAVNCVLQALVHVPPLRDFFLVPPPALTAAAARSALVASFGELVRKLWNPRAFRGHVSPHELLQAVSNASERRFRPGQPADPLDFLSWFLNRLHFELGGTKRPGSSIIHRTFQGHLRLWRRQISLLGPDEKPAEGAETQEQQQQQQQEQEQEQEQQLPFLYLSLEIPSAPLFKDAAEAAALPQVPLFTLLAQVDGHTWRALPSGEERCVRLEQLPRYLIFHLRRFARKTFFVEKNPTIVSFPVRGLDMAPYLDPEQLLRPGTPSCKYDLLACLRHEGPPEAGSWSVFLQHRPTQRWYLLQDLHREETMPQLISVSEATILIYERVEETPNTAIAAATTTTSSSSS
jgi:U4/U6.U5 tri-snRNP-associated protein 2